MTFDEIVAAEEETEVRAYAKLPIALARGEGCWVFDERGERWLDLYGGHAAAPRGPPARALRRRGGARGGRRRRHGGRPRRARPVDQRGGRGAARVLPRGGGDRARARRAAHLRRAADRPRAHGRLLLRRARGRGAGHDHPREGP